MSQPRGKTRKSVLLIGGCGYIGSYLYSRLIDSFDVKVCDYQVRGNPAGIPVDASVDYATLSASDLSGFDAVLWFAGHSSVQQATGEPTAALENNCLNLFALVKKLSPDTKFIYASTASLYSTRDPSTPPATETSLINIPAQNAYDISKFAFDYLASNFLGSFHGLRMGTLCGYSPNLRPELVFNAMNIAASTHGQLKLKNSSFMRTILFLSDLWIMVKNLLENDHKPGFYNAGSHTCSMAELALSIASVWDAQIIYEGDSEGYSFSLDCTKMRLICRKDLEQPSFESRCRDFISQYRQQGSLQHGQP